jgi:hypothetical protein
MDDQEFEGVRDLKYLGCIVKEDNETQNFGSKPNQLWTEETAELTVFKKTDKMCAV